MQRIYLDYAATTPVDPAVFAAMKPYFGNFPASNAKRSFVGWGNPGSLHSYGQEAIAAVDLARQKIATALGLPALQGFRQIIFTGSATEANNLAIRGIVNQLRIAHSGLKNSQFAIRNPRIITSAIEHESVLQTCKDLERDGVEIVYIKPKKNGIVDPADVEVALNERTILVSIMYANNEIGTIQPIAKIVEVIRNFRKELRIKNYELSKESNYRLPVINYPFFHTDAVQAFQFLDCVPSGHLPQGDNPAGPGVDFMTISAHKIYGPKGIGTLYIRNSKHEARNPKQFQNPKNKIQNVSDFGFRNSDLPLQWLSPIVTGGGQEFGLRSGTENVPSIAGFGKAVELVVESRKGEVKRIAELRDEFWKGIKKIYPRAELNGPPIRGNQSSNQQESAIRLPNIINVYFPGHRAEDLLMRMDLAGIAASSGSACRARSAQPSYALLACGMSNERVESSVRFSFGRPTTKEEIGEALKRMETVLRK